MSGFLGAILSPAAPIAAHSSSPTAARGEAPAPGAGTSAKNPGTTSQATIISITSSESRAASHGESKQVDSLFENQSSKDELQNAKDKLENSQAAIGQAVDVTA